MARGPTGSPPPVPAERWSPYPVQDWATLPHDPLAPALPREGDRDQRRWWVPLVVLLLLGALLGGTLQLAATGNSAIDTRATRFLPADGHVAYERSETRRGSAVSTADSVTESARLVGASAVLSGEGSFTGHFIQLAIDNPAMQVWRTTTTPVGAGAGAQTSRFYQTDGAVQLLGESGPGGGSVFAPALLALPAAVAPGQSWSSSGTAGPKRDYRSSLAAEAADHGCLRVRGTLTVAGVDSQQDQTWCPGEGVVASAVTGADGQASTVRSTPVASRPVTVGPLPRWSDPARWRERSTLTVSSDQNYGPAPMSGSLRPLPPVRTSSGLLVRVLAGGDVLAVEEAPQDQWLTSWRAHPGGDVVSLAGFGDVVVVTTSERQVVAYSAAGVRLWQRALPEIGPTPAVRLDDGRLVVVSLDGHVQAFGIADGRPAWSTDLGSDVTLVPAVGSGLVVVADRGGTVTALDAASGASRWTAPLLGTALAVTAGPAGTVLVTQDQVVHALRVGDGRHRWLHSFVGTITGLQPVGASVLVAGHSRSELLGADGTVLARLDPMLALTASADHVVGWGPSAASVLDGTGRLVVRWPLPATATVFTDRPAVALDDGVLLGTTTWESVQWGP